MLVLLTYSPWNGYPNLQDAIESEALYELGKYDADSSSYTAIADAMEVAQTTASKMIGVDAIHFALRKGNTTVDLDSKSLDEAIKLLLSKRTVSLYDDLMIYADEQGVSDRTLVRVLADTIQASGESDKVMNALVEAVEGQDSGD